MAGELFDIGGLFKDVLADPKAQQQASYEQKLGMFNNGWAGTLANLGSTFGSDLRGYTQQAGSAVNPNFDVRTADTKYRETVSAIDPEAEDAEQQYIEATKRYKPAKLPQLMENIKKNRREAAADARIAAQERRAETASSQATETFDNLRDGWHNTTERNRIALELAQQNLENVQDAAARPAAQKAWLMTTMAGQSPNYTEYLEGLSPEALEDEFKRVESMEGQIATGLRANIQNALGSEHRAIPLLKEMGTSQLQSIMNGITNKLITPDTEILGSGEKGYTMFVTDPLNPTQTRQITLTEGTARPPRQPAAITGRIDDILEAIPDVDTSWWWGRGDMEVERPSGGAATGKEILQDRAGSYYQLYTPTESVLKDTIRLASNALNDMDGSRASHSSINAVLDQYFPSGSSTGGAGVTGAAALIDAAIGSPAPSGTTTPPPAGTTTPPPAPPSPPSTSEKPPRTMTEADIAEIGFVPTGYEKMTSGKYVIDSDSKDWTGSGFRPPTKQEVLITSRSEVQEEFRRLERSGAAGSPLVLFNKAADIVTARKQEGR